MCDGILHVNMFHYVKKKPYIICTFFAKFIYKENITPYFNCTLLLQFLPVRPPPPCPKDLTSIKVMISNIFLILGGYHWMGVPTKYQYRYLGSIIRVWRFLNNIWIWKGIKIRTVDPKKTWSHQRLYTPNLYQGKVGTSPPNIHHLRMWPDPIEKHRRGYVWGWNLGIKSKQSCPMLIESLVR